MILHLTGIGTVDKLQLVNKINIIEWFRIHQRIKVTLSLSKKIILVKASGPTDELEEN